MMVDQWNSTRKGVFPENGETVVIIRSDGSSQKMKFASHLWFLEPDFVVYTYFVPEFWRSLREDER